MCRHIQSGLSGQCLEICRQRQLFHHGLAQVSYWQGPVESIQGKAGLIKPMTVFGSQYAKPSR